MEAPTNTPANSRAIGIKFGLISAVSSIVIFLILVFTGQNAFDNKWSWISIVISIALMVLAHKNFKEDNDGFMSYGEGVGVGFWMILASVVVGAAFTYIFVTFVDPGVMDTFYEKQYEQMQEKGMPDDQIEVAISWTKKLFWAFYLFFGFLFSVIMILIVTIFTQKKSPEQRF